MGVKFIDNYTISHAISGYILYMLQFTLKDAITLHTAFELFENYYWVPVHGKRCVKLPFLNVIDCKTNPDSIINIIGDTIAFYIGFVLAQRYSTIKLNTQWRILLPLLPLVLSTITTNIIAYSS